MRHLIPCALVMILAGCTSVTPAPAPEMPRTANEIAFDLLGPAPTNAPLTDDERTGRLATTADRWWEMVATAHPAAVRPSVTVEAMLTPNGPAEERSACFADEGFAAAPTGSWMLDGTMSEAEFLAWYTCMVRFPDEPEATVNDAQLGYLYDYLTQFVAPCLEEFGTRLPTPPSREYFVANWPRQDWYPQPNSGPGSTETADRLACPSGLVF